MTGTVIQRIRLVALFSMVIPASFSEARPIAIGMPNDVTVQATASVVKALIEDQLGKDVQMVKPGGIPVIWEGLNRNSGEIDIWTDVWLPNQQAMVEKYAGPDGAVKVTKNYYAGTQGYCTTKAIMEKHDIRTVFDLSDPEKAKVFDVTGSGKGKVWLGAPGWLSTNIERIRAYSYGFADFFELQAVDEAVATAELDAAHKTGGPWLGYCYTPTQNVIRYDLVRLEEPPHNDKDWIIADQKDPHWLENSSIKSGYKDAEVHIAYTKSLAIDEPKVAELLEKIQFTTDDVSKLAYAIAVDGKSPEQAAKEWLAANPAIVANWTPN